MPSPAHIRHDFPVNPRAVISAMRLGLQQEPLIVVNDMLRDPDALVEFAATQIVYQPAGRGDGGYPGLRGPAPLNYVAHVAKAVGPLLMRIFGLKDVALSNASCSFSIVTTPPDQLTVGQRMPHVDTVDPLQFALLHYLCDARFGGTSFYRHRATGFETISEQNEADYEAAWQEEVAERLPSPGYVSGDTERYERIGSCDARFNRLAIYRSCLLHSGNIPSDAILSSDPRRGRLTANIFLNYGPIS